MTYCKPGWKPVTTELRGDRWLGREAEYQMLARLYDIPVEFLRPSRTYSLPPSSSSST